MNLVTTLASCGLGFVSGFGVTAFEAQQTAATTHSAYIPLEFALQQCTRSTYGPICPLAQPGATVIALEPYYANRIAAPPYYSLNQSMPQNTGRYSCGRQLRMEGVPGARHPHAHRSSHGITDATPIAIMLPLFVIGILICFRKKLFPST